MLICSYEEYWQEYCQKQHKRPNGSTFYECFIKDVLSVDTQVGEWNYHRKPKYQIGIWDIKTDVYHIRNDTQYKHK